MAKVRILRCFQFYGWCLRISTSGTLNDILLIRSPLSQVQEFTDVAALIFIGSEDERVLPEAHGITFYKALRSQKTVPVSLYHYPGEGHDFKGLESIHHMWSKSVAWMHKYWRTFEEGCSYEDPNESTTTEGTSDGNGGGATASSTQRPPISAGSSTDHFKAFFVILLMQVFTLSVWYQFKY